MRRLLISLCILPLLAHPIDARLPKNPSSIQPLYDGEGENICTTESVNERHGLWLTAAHCVEPSDNFVRVIMGKPAYVAYADPVIDLALLRSDAKAPELRLGKRPRFGDIVNVAGYPLGLGQFLTTWLRISNLEYKVEDRWFLVLDGTVLPGHSGSPVLDEDGRIIAVLQAGFNAGPITLASPYKVLTAFLNRIVISADGSRYAVNVN